MANPTPQRFTGRAGARLPGRVRRALDAQVDTQRRLGETLDVDKDGRMQVRAASGGGLVQTKQGLVVDPGAVGDKNLAPMALVKDLDSTAVLADVIAKMNELLSEHRRTKRMRG